MISTVDADNRKTPVPETEKPYLEQRNDIALRTQDVTKREDEEPLGIPKLHN